jgi:hypothetical protein
MEIKRKAMRRPRLSYQMGIDGDIVEFPKKDRQNWSWTHSQRLRANHIRNITEDLKEYWPLTVRQVYYRSLGVVPGSHIKSWYDTLSKLITQMRIDGLLEWDAIEDRTRQLYEKLVWENRYEYLKWKVKDFFGDYDRCYVQNQENYVEVWVEKDALSHILQRAAGPYCVRVLTGRGYQSYLITGLRIRLERSRRYLVGAP